MTAELSAFTRRRLDAIAERALLAAGVAGQLPTPLEEVQRAAGIVARHDIAGLARPSGAPGRPSAAPGRLSAALLGAIWFEARTVYVDLRQAAPRRRFTDAHEAMHALCPWHAAALRTDGAAELFGPARDAIEAEANHGAAQLIFQGRRFAARIAAEPRTIATALELAATYGASRQATLHQYVAAHPAATALIVAGRFPAAGGGLPVWRAVGSPAFAERFGRWPARALRPGDALRELAEAARTAGTSPAMTLLLPDRGGRLRRCVAEAHYNRHTFAILVTERPLSAARRAAPSPTRCAAAR